jgi:uncharacterized protein YcnI
MTTNAAEGGLLSASAVRSGRHPGTGRRLATVGAALVGLAAAGVLTASGAWAHVTVAAPGVSVGASDASITFRVPDESDTASTTDLKVQLPTATPIAGVLVAPQPGWTATITQSKLATPIKTGDGVITEVVSQIDWKADSGAGIRPGYFGQFTVIAGKLPDSTSSLTFKAIQRYSDGKTVSWIEIAAPGSTQEPEHPAPVLELAAADSGASPGASASPASSAAATAVTAVAATKDAASKGAATTGIVLGGLGAVLGAVALGLVLLRRRPSAQ